MSRMSELHAAREDLTGLLKTLSDGQAMLIDILAELNISMTVSKTLGTSLREEDFVLIKRATDILNDGINLMSEDLLHVGALRIL